MQYYGKCLNPLFQEFTTEKIDCGNWLNQLFIDGKYWEQTGNDEVSLGGRNRHDDL